MVEKYSMPIEQSLAQTQVLTSERVAQLRHAYRQGPIYLNVKFFRVQLLTIRRLMDGKQRSSEYGPDTARGVRTAQA
jgi:hypothetical protein